MLTGLHHIGVFTSDIANSEKFYEMIGFESYYKNAAPSGSQIVFVRAGSCVIELIQPTDSTKALGRPEGQIAHIAIAVKDIESTVKELQAKGVVFDVEAPGHNPGFMAGGMKNIFFTGPAGERLELFEEL